MNFSQIGMVLVFLAAFAVCAMAVGFFKAAMQQRKIDREAEKQKQAEQEMIEAKKAEKQRAKEEYERAKRQENRKPMKRLGE